MGPLFQVASLARVITTSFSKEVSSHDLGPVPGVEKESGDSVEV